MLEQAELLDDIYTRAINGKELTTEDIVYMYDIADLNSLGYIARKITDQFTGRYTSFVSNLILNYTNICNVRCKFCAFYRTGTENDAYLLSKEEIINKISHFYDNYHIKQLLIQGGVNPSLGLDYFTDLFGEIRDNFPDLGIHGLSTSEISFISKKERLSISDTLIALVKSGMQTIPGAGAEIFSSEVRKKIGRPPKSGEEWLQIMEEAHKLGLKSSATMMFGHVEESVHKAQHLLSILELQKKYYGFMSFTPWNFEPGNTQLQKDGIVKYRVGGMDVLRNIAIARIVFNRYLPIIQSSWLTNGVQMGQMAVLFGANDWGGTIYDEKVIPATGKKVGNLRKESIINNLFDIGMIPVERDNLYRVVRYYGH